MKDISIENAILKKTFIQNKKKKQIALTQIIPVNHFEENITILIIPPNGGNSSILAEITQPLIEVGYMVYLFDYEGYGESQGKANNQNVLDDAQIVLNYVIANKTDNSKLVLWGFSLGGNLAVKVALENSSHIDALILEGAFTSHQEIAKEKAPKWLKWLAKLIQNPYPSKELITKIHVPVLIAHSLDDEVCPYSMGKTLYENANEPKCFLQLSGEHCYGLLQETDKYMKCLKLFLNQNNIK
jgi:alpha-beta hydrolase superfamily lysophospholipase